MQPNSRKVVSESEQSGDSLEKGSQGREMSQWVRLSLTAGVACLQMASTMGLITVGGNTHTSTQLIN